MEFCTRGILVKTPESWRRQCRNIIRTVAGGRRTDREGNRMPGLALKTIAREERRLYGQSLRPKINRASQADWDSTRRKASALELLRASERGRLANLLPIKAARMAAS